MNIASVISAAADRLRRARIEEPRLEAESLLAHLLDRDLSWILAHPEADVMSTVIKTFAQLVAKRAARVPYAYLTGVKSFYGRDFRVTPATLIPRPETETLVEALLSRIPVTSTATIVDVGTGSGAIGATLAAERAKTKAILYDVSKKALDVAASNISRLKLGRRVRCARLDILHQALPEPKGASVVVANLPYLPDAVWKRSRPEVRTHEPKLALVSGADGLRHYRALFKRLMVWKRRPVMIAIEAEPEQFPELADLTRALLPDARPEILKDLHGDDRVLIAARP